MLPERPVAGDPVVGRAHGGSVQSAPVDPTVDLAPDQPGALKDPHVLGDGWQRHVVRPGQLGNRRRRRRQLREQPPAGAVGERPEDKIEALVGRRGHLGRFMFRRGPGMQSLNHMVFFQAVELTLQRTANCRETA